MIDRLIIAHISFSPIHMKIDKIDLFQTRIPLKKTFIMGDKPIEYFDTILLRMESNGVSGWSEVFPGNAPILTAAWSSAVFCCLRDCILPMLELGVSVPSGENLSEMLSGIKGNRHAKAALDLAWWDLNSKLDGKPLYESIGAQKRAVEVGRTFDRYDSPNEFLEDFAKAVRNGYRRITMKIRPGWDLHALGAVRAQFPTVMLQCDVEGALSLDQHSEMIYRFDDFMPALLEQPLSSSEYVGHAMLEDRLRTSIALDESITTLHQAHIALDLRSCSTICLKAGRMGGLTEAKAIHDAAEACEINSYAGCDLLSSIGYRSVIALGMLSNCTIPADYIPLEDFLQYDPGTPLIPVLKKWEKPEPTEPQEEKYEYHLDENGEMVEDRIVNSGEKSCFDEEARLVIEPWEEPGIGFEPDLEWIEANSKFRYSWPEK